MTQPIPLWTHSRGTGRSIVFIHGWTMDHRDEMRTYEPIFSGLEGWRRHYLDLPGMGRTPPSPTIRTLDDMLAACLDAIAALVGRGRFCLAGTSAGAYLARGVLARMRGQVAGLLLRVPLVVPGDADRDLDKVRPLITDDAAVAVLDADERAALGEVLVQTPAYVATLRAKLHEAVAPAQQLADDPFLSAIRDDPARYRFSFDPDAAPVLCAGPSLIVAGRHDTHVGYRDAWRLMAKLPRAGFAVLDRAEHGLPIDQQALFSALVHDWLVRVREQEGAQG